MIIIRKVWGEDKKLHDVQESVPVSAGDHIQWNEQSKCITITRNDEMLYWEGMQAKKFISWIHTESQFGDYVVNSAMMLNLKAEKISAGRHPTFEFK